MLSWMLTPLMVNVLSNDMPPAIVTIPLGPFVLTPGVRETDDWMVRATGSLSRVSAEYVVVAADPWETVSLCAETLTTVATPDSESLALKAICWPDETFVVFVTV